ncbi:MAG: hypothetical protein CL724_08530 [Chloroflexi bacterium]|nr:hypothetical protein [Chloroflexota bacterium]
MAAAELDSWFEVLKTSDLLLSGWRSATDEGYYPLRGLLDDVAYPDGQNFATNRGRMYGWSTERCLCTRRSRSGRS